VWGVRGTKS